MNLENVQELRNSIQELRNNNSLEAVKAIVENMGGNPIHATVSIEVALREINNAETKQEEVLVKFDDLLNQIENLLRQAP
ncbi:hypothetical protein [Chryseobacterium caseinilyticum]|uniref:Uncharacterized protein n=1 Tax=Chryseobacterium caseinilyticum TaxID=2771428 RepID=A0ABR8ZGU9_9FLAO|nr:hypothetical protein [Chryseobacterium caseinilyticum]MBD8084487.1 hypothetical protein [Chryseobacterium caseinilyticum]